MKYYPPQSLLFFLELLLEKEGIKVRQLSKPEGTIAFGNHLKQQYNLSTHSNKVTYLTNKNKLYHILQFIQHLVSHDLILYRLILYDLIRTY